MSDAGLQLNDTGLAKVSGPLTFASAPDLLKQGKQLLQQATDAIAINLAAVTHVDSAGVALLLEWRKLALAASVNLTYNNIPDGVLAIARISDVETMLGNSSH